jgi:hypothetical protein
VRAQARSTISPRRGVGSQQPRVAASFGTSSARLSGAPGVPGFGLSAKALLLHSSRHPQRLTIRSSRPRIVASAVCYTLRLHTSAAPLRGGLTQALGINGQTTSRTRVSKSKTCL